MSSFDFSIDEVPNSLFTLRDEVRTFLARSRLRQLFAHGGRLGPL